MIYSLYMKAILSTESLTAAALAASVLLCPPSQVEIRTPSFPLVGQNILRSVDVATVGVETPDFKITDQKAAPGLPKARRPRFNRV